MEAQQTEATRAAIKQLQADFNSHAESAAGEIRRLHARNQELEAMLDAVGAGGVSAQRITQAADHIAQDRKMVAAQEPFGYFKAEPFGWRDCAETDEGAIALYDAPQPQADARDAERYRFLRSRDLETVNNGGVFAGVTPDNIVLNGTDLDAEIDAAIAAAKEAI